jgi:cellulose synthase/poly-beta-1,6-N-acetylglucosamine synthase-like glycosyltransferase
LETFFLIPLFWTAIFYIFYTEIGYMILLYIYSFIGKKKLILDTDSQSVAIFIAAYNEANIIRLKIENCLSLDYPSDCLQILIASDCSTDGTDEIVDSYSYKGVKLVRNCPRQGKIAALRAAEPLINSDLVLFTDADSTLSPNSLRSLVKWFADPQVGAVSGKERRPSTGTTSKGKGEGLYNRLDTKIKTLEGQIGNQVGVHGGIFMVRRELMPYVPDHLSHDAIIPLTLVLGGYKVLYEPEAISTEPYDLDTSQDWRRRIRTVLQSIQSYLYVKEALNPFRTGFYAVQVWSHRFMRWFVFQ